MEPFDPLGPLVPGTLVRRYKRFLADVEVDGQPVTAHCANSGSMMGLQDPGMPVLLRHAPSPTRKLAYAWELVSPDAGRTWVGINTARPNQVVEHLVRAGRIEGLDPSEGVRREVPYGANSRIDLLLGQDHYVEVKNTTLARDGAALFPDAVTTRGAKHMLELARVVQAGGRATVVFFVNRADCDRFGVAADIDPDYAKAFAKARKAGVRMLPLGMAVGPDGWRVRGGLPFDPLRS